MVLQNKVIKTGGSPLIGTTSFSVQTKRPVKTGLGYHHARDSVKSRNDCYIESAVF